MSNENDLSDKLKENSNINNVTASEESLGIKTVNSGGTIRILQRVRSSSTQRAQSKTSSERSKKIPPNCASIETQTEWSWMQDLQLIQRIRKESADILGEILQDAEVESEESDDESIQSKESVKQAPVTVQPETNSIGPPKILQYKPEKKVSSDVKDGANTPNIEEEPEVIDDLRSFMKDFNVYINGGHSCEFCGNITKAWPTAQQQEIVDQFKLYCCLDYKDFVESIIEYQNEKENIIQQNIVKENEKLKKSKAKKIASERSHYRNMQKLIEKQRNVEQQKEQQHNASKQKALPNQKVTELKMEKTSDSLLTPYQREPMANQIRSINYQLSNLKYLQEGWTVRPQTPLEADELGIFDEVEFNLLAQSAPVNPLAKIYPKPLVIRKYKNGSNCLILFPDGSGTAFYQSGRVAISIVNVAEDMHIMTLFTDDELNPTQIASFDPYGNGYANFLNGQIKFLLNPFGGIEFDSDGMKKKRWFWWDTTCHVPPFQPLKFSFNNNLTIKISNHDKIDVNFFSENQICKFRIGTKIKISKPESLVNNIKVDNSENYLKRKRMQIDELIKMMSDNSNSVKLPKLVNPKTINYLTPRSVKKTNYEMVAQESNAKNVKQKSSRFLTVP